MELKAEKFVSECFRIELNCRDVTELRFIELAWYIPDDAVERLHSKALQHKYIYIYFHSSIIFVSNDRKECDDL